MRHLYSPVGAFFAIVAVAFLITLLGGPPAESISSMALAAVVQTVYSERMARGVPGLIADMTNYDTISRTVETAAGIGFGLAVCRGTNDKGIVLGGTLAAFQGALIRDPTLEPGDEDAAQQYSVAGVMRKGTMWVTAGEAASAGDPVHFNGTTGAFLTAGEQGPIVGAEWIDSVAAGEVGRIYLAGVHS